MGTRQARLVRGIVAAAVATFVAAFSHSVAAGEVPSTFSLAVSFALSVFVCVTLTGATLSLTRTVGAVAVSQAVFHTLFSAVGAPAATITATDATHHALVTVDAALASGHHHVGWMWAAHALAAVVTVVALRFGEGAWWGLVATARLALSSIARWAAVATAAVAGVPRLAVADRFFIRRELGILLSAMRHRGPPRSIAFA